MEQLKNQRSLTVEDADIDVVELMQRLWRNKGFILKVTFVCVVLGLGVALLIPKRFTASCDFVPQVTAGLGQSRMSSIIRLAGVDLSQNQDVEMLSPCVYENILTSTRFRKELMHTKINVEDVAYPISIYEYYSLHRDMLSRPEAAPLPGVAPNIETLTQDEYCAIKQLAEQLRLTLDNKNGYVTISATMPEPLAAAQLAQAAVELLQKYITEFKIAKVKSNLDFVQQRHDELKLSLESVQARRARYRDANQNMVRNSARMELERLEAEYQLAMNMYGEMAMQLQQAKIRVKETMPMLTIINPVTVPTHRSSPQRMKILLASLFVGLVMGGCGVVVIPTIADVVGSGRLRALINVEAVKSNT